MSEELSSKELARVISRNTCVAKAGSWARNIVANEFTIRNGHGINELFGLCKPTKLPVILVGAGPSLDKNVKELKKCCGRAFIIACNSAHKTLSQADIKPDMVFIADTRPETARTIDSENSENVILCTKSLVYPEVPESWRGPVYWFNNAPTNDSPLTSSFINFTGQIGELTGCGSVLTLMFSLAILLVSDLIVFVGCDAAYYEPEKHHAIDSLSFDFSGYNESETTDVYGQKCFTNEVLTLYSEWLGDVCCRIVGSKIFINATEGGRISSGCLVMSLKQVRKKFLTKKFDIQRILSKHRIPKDAKLRKRWKFKGSEGPIPHRFVTYLPADFLSSLIGEKCKDANLLK